MISERTNTKAAKLIDSIAKKYHTVKKEKLMLLVCEELEFKYGEHMNEKARFLGIETSSKLSNEVDKYLAAQPAFSKLSPDGDPIPITKEALHMIDALSRGYDTVDPKELIQRVYEKLEQYGEAMTRTANRMGLRTNSDVQRCVEIYLITRQDFPTYRMVRPSTPRKTSKSKKEGAQ